MEPKGGSRVVDLAGLPDPVADALVALVSEVGRCAGAVTRSERVSREHLGDLVQAAEAVKGFADAAALDATSALVEDVAVDHGVNVDDPRYSAKVVVHRKHACRAVVHEVQLLTGSTLTAARDRVRFATAMDERVGAAHDLLRAGGCSWERARIAYTETSHLDPVLAGQVIDRLLAPPDRTSAADADGQSVPLSHSGFRARIRRQLALVESAATDRERRHADAVERRDACTFPGLGFLTAEQVREVAGQAGSTWARLVTDPVTGEVIDAANTYRVPAGMSRLVMSRDHTCRAPGDCGVSAADADVDHDTEYAPDATDPAEGATHPDNLHAMHRGHHNAKTGKFWDSQQQTDASITWQTLTRRLRTTAYDHDRPGDRCPPFASRMERAFGIRLALYREHDVTPNVFTDLEDLNVLTDRDQPHNQQGHDDRQAHDGHGSGRLFRGRMQFYPPSHNIRIELPERPPPF